MVRSARPTLAEVPLADLILPNRPLATEYQRSVHEGVDPRQPSEVIGAEHSDAQGDSHHDCREAEKAENASTRSIRRQYRVCPVLNMLSIAPPSCALQGGGSGSRPVPVTRHATNSVAGPRFQKYHPPSFR